MLSREVLSKVELQQYKLVVDRGISYDRAKELLDEKRRANPGAALFKGAPPRVMST